MPLFEVFKPKKPKELKEREKEAYKESYEKGRIAQAKEKGFREGHREKRGFLATLGTALIQGIEPPRRERTRQERKHKKKSRNRERRSIYF